MSPLKAFCGSMVLMFSLFSVEAQPVPLIIASVFCTIYLQIKK